MIIYRPYRGFVAVEMKEAKEFEDETAMKEYIVAQYNNLFFAKVLSVEDIVLGTTTFEDIRVGWHDSRHVLKRDKDVSKIIGMCATKYDKKIKKRGVI